MICQIVCRPQGPYKLQTVIFKKINRRPQGSTRTTHSDFPTKNKLLTLSSPDMISLKRKKTELLDGGGIILPLRKEGLIKALHVVKSSTTDSPGKSCCFQLLSTSLP